MTATTQEKPKTKQSFIQEVFEKLSSIDIDEYVSHHEIKQKDNSGNYVKKILTSLSWPHCYRLMRRNFPIFEYRFKQFKVEHGNEVGYYMDPVTQTAYVTCTVTVGDSNGEIAEIVESLGVRRGYHCVKLPDSQLILNTQKRCLVKACALLGLGLHLWFRDDDDVAEATTPPVIEAPRPQQQSYGQPYNQRPAQQPQQYGAPPNQNASQADGGLTAEDMVAGLRQKQQEWDPFLFDFVPSVESGLAQYGSLTDKQMGALRKNYRKLVLGEWTQ